MSDRRGPAPGTSERPRHGGYIVSRAVGLGLMLLSVGGLVCGLRTSLDQTRPAASRYPPNALHRHSVVESIRRVAQPGISSVARHPVLYHALTFWLVDASQCDDTVHPKVNPVFMIISAEAIELLSAPAINKSTRNARVVGPML